jgi:hypothetical protein
MQRAAASLAVAAALGASGCNEAKLRGDSLEPLIVRELAKRGHHGAKVTCSDVADRAGQRYACALAGVEGRSRVEGTVLSGDRISIDRLR